MAPRKTWTDEQFIKAVEISDSVADTLRNLGLTIHGSSYSTIKKHIKRLGLDTSHWTRKKNLNTDHLRHKPLSLEEILVENSPADRQCVKKRLLKEGLLKNECAICGLAETWNYKPIIMVLDHINGIADDNRLKNLRMLCPNCNSQQPTFAGKNKKVNRLPKAVCGGCGKTIGFRNKTGYCVTCMPKYIHKGRSNQDRKICESGEIGICKRLKISWP